MTQKELKKYLMDAANILRGMIDAADFKQYIFPLLFFKRISDVWDEECKEALAESDGDWDYAKFRENHRFQIPDGCHWENVRKASVDVGLALQNALRGIENANFELLHDVFGDAQWTNKRRMSDEKMLDLIEHFSKTNLNITNVPHDLMGDGYEYLIKKFADDSGHTAAEFYTNRTVVKLMTLITDPQPQESVYDPTCGSGGILLNSVLYLKEQGKEYRNVKLFGQELNLITSAIARINMFMHNVDEFLIVQGDTLDRPQILEDDALKRFDVVMANPPYSVKRWNQTKFANDPFGRNIYGTPPQGTADYAFLQHIIKSLKSETGRCVVLFPHGILFRDAEAEMRKKMIADDIVDAVIGLGEKLFYNSNMESCLLVCRTNKPPERKEKILFIDAKNEIRFERSNAYLKDEHIQKIANAYRNFEDIEGFAKVVRRREVLEGNNGNLGIQSYVKSISIDASSSIEELVKRIATDQRLLQESTDGLVARLEEIEFRDVVSGLTSEKPYFGKILEGKTLTKVRFADVAVKLTRRIDPELSGVERIVAGENLESDDFRIRTWGTVGKDFLGPAFHVLFRKGDILYGSRRTYLRKVAVADFDGVCANTTFVIRAKENILLQGLLKHIMHSDAFTEYSISVSKGSTNPYINWKDLNNFTFWIPDIETQKEIVGILDKVVRIAEASEEQAKSFKSLKFKLANRLVSQE
jgi:type I restriction enzyme M protein